MIEEPPRRDSIASTSRLRAFFMVPTMGLNQPFVAWYFAVQFSDCDFDN